MATPKIQVQQRYQIEDEIGAGAMGTVYLAHDVVIDRRVVLKTLRPERLVEEGEQRHLIEEARSAGRINHPNLVTVYDVVNDLETDRVYLALEYVEGRTLRDLIREVGKLDAEDALDIALQVSAGLAHLHEAGLIHRDIKPSNILIDGKGTVKITDFGIARAAGVSQLEDDGSVFGTPPYMAPEQLLGLEVDARCDVFSLGVVTYEMLTGAKPFGGRTAKEIARRTLGAELKPIGSIAPEIPAEICAAVERAMERETSARYPSIPAFAEELARAAGRPEDDPGGRVTSRLVAVRTAVPPDPSGTVAIGGRRAKALLGGLRRWAREPWAARARLLALTALLVLVAGVAASWLVFERFDSEPMAETDGGLAPELYALQARVVTQGRQLIEAGDLAGARAVLTFLEELAPDEESTRRLQIRLEAEQASREEEAEAAKLEPPPRATSPREAVAAVRDALEGADDPVAESVLAQLDETLGRLTVPEELTRIELSARSEKERINVMVRSGADSLFNAESKKKRRGFFGKAYVEPLADTIDIAADTRELMVYVTIGSDPAELHRFAGPFEGGGRLVLDIEVDRAGEAKVALDPPRARTASS